MRTLKFEAQPTNAFFATFNQMFGGSPQLPTTAERAVIKLNRWAQFRQHSRKLGGAAEHLIDGSEKRVCRLSFEFCFVLFCFLSPHVIERRSKRLSSILSNPLNKIFNPPLCPKSVLAS